MSKILTPKQQKELEKLNEKYNLNKICSIITDEQKFKMGKAFALADINIKASKGQISWAEALAKIEEINAQFYSPIQENDNE